MGSTFEVKVVPDASGFAESIREQMAEVLADLQLGVIATTVETFEYNEIGDVIKRTCTVSIGGES